jgi:hypothetical protein
MNILRAGPKRASFCFGGYNREQNIGTLDIRKLGDMLYSGKYKWFNNYININTFFGKKILYLVLLNPSDCLTLHFIKEKYDRTEI